MQRILKTLKLRLIFLFKNCFDLFFCLTYLERVSGKRIKLESEKLSISNKEAQTLRWLWNPLSLYAECNTLKVALSPSKKFLYLLQWLPFTNDEKCFLFYLKSSFRSQDIEIFVLTFWACRKNGLIRKIRLISKFMTSQSG